MVRQRVVRCRLVVLMAEQDPPLTQTRLRQETNLSPTIINRLFHNTFQRVDVKTVRTLCNYFNCEVGDLFVMREIEEEEAN